MFPDAERETAHRVRTRHDEALAHCVRILQQAASTEEAKNKILTNALERLRKAVLAHRVYLFESYEDPALGPCCGMRVESCEPGIRPHIENPANRRMPWARLPGEMYHSLKQGSEFGGPVERAFASTPEWIEIFHKQTDPLLSVQLFPIHIRERWWGFIGFDDVKTARVWDESELRILRIAADIISNVIHRWEIESALRIEEKQRIRGQERLRLLESVVVNTNEGILITSSHNINPPGPRILYANDAFCRMTGYKPEEVLGQNPRLLQGPRTSRQKLDQIRASLEKFEAVDVELVNYRKDGSDFWVRISIVPVFDNAQKCTHFVAIQQDITSRKQDEKALWSAKRELEARVAERTEDLARANRKLRAEIISREHAEREVRHRLAIEETLARISTQLVTVTSVDSVLPSIFKDVAHLIDAGQVALILLDDRWKDMGIVFEWHAPHAREVEWAKIRDIVRTLEWTITAAEREVIYVEDSQQPASAGVQDPSPLSQFLEGPAFMLPLWVDSRLEGFLIATALAGEHRLPAERWDILNVVLGFVASVLQREALLHSLEQRAIKRTRELATFFDLTMLAGAAESLLDILESALLHIVQAIHCQAASVHELSETGDTLIRIADFGLSKASDGEAVVLTEEFARWFDAHNEPIIEDDLSEANWLPADLRPPEFAVLIGAQVRVRGKALGILSCYMKEPNSYSLDSTALAVALAEHLGIVIENYRLRLQAEEGAVVQERQRLARELHDAITQSLYSVTLFARSGADALEAGELNKAFGALTEIEVNTLRSLKEMRLLLFQLQPLALAHYGLEAALKNRFHQVERRLGIETVLAIEDGLRLLPRAEEAVYRIVTEALNNSLRHAGASKVSVNLRRETARIRLAVKDDGCGFDVTGTHGLGMGIKNMKERAVGLQGGFEIRSTAGKGTTVAVHFPLSWLE